MTASSLAQTLDLYPAIVALMGWAEEHLSAPDDGAAVELIHVEARRA